MKIKIVLLTTLFAMFSIAADGRRPRRAARTGSNAIPGERAAAARYDAFAVKATEEGYLGAADMSARRRRPAHPSRTLHRVVERAGD